MQLWCADSYLGVRVCISRYENMKLLTIGKETKAEHIYRLCSYICLTRLCTVFRSVVVMLQSVQFFTACLLLGMQKMLGVHTGQSGWISTKTVNWSGAFRGEWPKQQPMRGKDIAIWHQVKVLHLECFWKHATRLPSHPKLRNVDYSKLSTTQQWHNQWSTLYVDKALLVQVHVHRVGFN